MRLGCVMVVELIKNAETKSASTLSRLRITISVDDTNLARYAKKMSYCSNCWWKKHHNTFWGQNVLGITLKIGDIIIPLNTRLVSKKGRGNTGKPSLLVAMLKEVLEFFDAEGIDLRNYSITFDSWYGSYNLISKTKTDSRA